MLAKTLFIESVSCRDIYNKNLLNHIIINTDKQKQFTSQ